MLLWNVLKVNACCLTCCLREVTDGQSSQTLKQKAQMKFRVHLHGCCTVCTLINNKDDKVMLYMSMYVTETRPSPANWGLRSAQHRTAGSYDFLPWGGGTINPWDLGYVWTHTVHTPTSSPSCSRNAYGSEHKAGSVCPRCTYHNVQCVQSQCSTQSNHLIVELSKFFF